MAKVCLLWFFVAEILLIQAMAGDSERSELSTPSQPELRRGPASQWVVARTTDRGVSVAPKPSESEGEEEGSRAADAPEIRRMGKHHTDKSVAGGGVIIGGLVTAIFAAVFCYIRVTRKRDDGARCGSLSS